MSDYANEARVERQLESLHERTLRAEQTARWCDEAPTLAAPFTLSSGTPTRSASTADAARPAVAAIAAPDAPALRTPGQPTHAPTHAPTCGCADAVLLASLADAVRTLQTTVREQGRQIRTLWYSVPV